MELTWPDWIKPDPNAANRPNLLPRPMSLERREGALRVGLQSTRRYDNARLTVKTAGRPVFETALDLARLVLPPGS